LHVEEEVGVVCICRGGGTQIWRQPGYLQIYLWHCKTFMNFSGLKAKFSWHAYVRILQHLHYFSGLEVAVSLIPSDPPCKDGNVRFTKVSFKPSTVYRCQRTLCVYLSNSVQIVGKQDVAYNSLNSTQLTLHVHIHKK